MPDNPFVSVVVINYNGVKYLGEILDNCIKSILKNEYDNFELLVIDNGSSDGSVGFLENEFAYDKRVKIIALKENLGTSGAKNVGIRSSKGKYVFVLNNDIYLKKETLHRLVDVLEKDPKLGILSARLVTPKGELQTEGNFFSYKTSLLGAVYPSLLDMQQSKRIAENRAGKLNIIDWMTGAALMLRKDVVTEVNMYDKDYFMYSEEVDLAYRVKQAGYKVACLNDYEIIHYGNVTASHFNDWRRDLMARNILLYFFKNFYGLKLAKSLFNFILGILMRFFISLFRLDELEWKIAISQIKAFQYIKKPAMRPN